MPSPSPADAGAQTAPALAAPRLAAPTLGDVRAELDRIDDALHDLLMERAAVVGRLAEGRLKGPAVLRPGREAAILRRLLARHRGALPPAAVVRSETVPAALS